MSEGSEYKYQSSGGNNSSDSSAPQGYQQYASSGFDTMTIVAKQARLMGYLEGYLDQLSTTKDNQEELISRLLNEVRDLTS